MRSLRLALPLALVAGCTKSPAPAPSPPTGSRTQLTPADCQSQGGKVVGDIGDGAVHRPDYKCPDSGAPPIATVVAAPGEPVAVEGSVCCR